MTVCGGITGRNGDDDEHKGNEPKVTEIFIKTTCLFSFTMSYFIEVEEGLWRSIVTVVRVYKFMQVHDISFLCTWTFRWLVFLGNFGLS